MNRSIERKMLAGFSLVLLCLLTMCAVIIQMRGQHEELSDRARLSREVQTQIERTLLRVTDAQTAVNDQVLQQDFSKRKTLPDIAVPVWNEFHRLEDLTKNDPVYQTDLDTIRPRLAQQTNLLTSLIRSAQQGYPEAAQRRMVAAQNRRDEERLQAEFGVMLQREKGRIEARITRFDSYTSRVFPTMLLLCLLTIAVLAAVFCGVRATDRKRQEAHLRLIAAERQVQEISSVQSAILKSANFSIISIDLNGKIQTLNDAAERWHGYTKEEAVGKLCFSALFDPQELIRRADEMSRLLGRTIEPGLEVCAAKAGAGVSEEQETTFIRKDGSRFPVLVSITPLRDEQGRISGYLSIASDMTERRKNAEEREALAAIVENAHEFIEMSTLDGDLLYINRAGRKMVGLEETQEIRSLHISDLGTHESWRITRDAAIPALHEQGYWIGEGHLWNRQTGQVVEVEKNSFLIQHPLTGEPYCMASTQRDVTMQRQAQRDLQESEQLLQEAQHVAKVGNWEFDVATGKITWSKELFVLLGCDPAKGEPNYQNAIACYHPDDLILLDNAFQKALTEGIPYALDLRGAESEGQPSRWYHTVGKPTFGSDGKVIRMFGTLLDITERKYAERLLKTLHRQNESLLESIGEGIYGIDAAGRATFVNPATAALLGYTTEELLGQNMHELLHHSREDKTPYPTEECPIYQGLRGGEGCRVSNEVFWRKDGSCLPVEYVCTPLFEDGEAAGLVVAFQDVTERRKYLKEIESAYSQIEEQVLIANEQSAELAYQKDELERANVKLEALATTDGLTGIKNHRAFQEELATVLDVCVRYQRPVSLLLMDVDKFKTFNDTYGHPAGDKVLKTVARLLQGNARTSDFVARYGGEEFVVILPETDIEGALEAAERFRAAIEAYPWEERQVTASIGAATHRLDSDTQQSLIEFADKALYASKAGGRNRATHHDELTESRDQAEPGDNLIMPFAPMRTKVLQKQ